MPFAKGPPCLTTSAGLLPLPGPLHVTLVGRGDFPKDQAKSQLPLRHDGCFCWKCVDSNRLTPC